MRVILKVWSSNPDYNGGCDFALAEITSDFAKLAVRRVDALRGQKMLDPAVDETYYWDSVADFFSPGVHPGPDTAESEVAGLKLDEELDLLQIDKNEVVTAPGNFSVPESQIARIECAQMVVRESGIAFTAIPKHTDFHVTTAEISRQLLETALTPAAE